MVVGASWIVVTIKLTFLQYKKLGWYSVVLFAPQRAASVTAVKIIIIIKFLQILCL
jgi:hypothetical protein